MLARSVHLKGTTMQQPKFSLARKRLDVEGSCQLNNTSAVSLPQGDGTMARTGVGTFTVTFDRDLGTLVSITGHLNAGTGDQQIGSMTSAVTGGVTVLTITTIDISGGAAADLNSVRLNWRATFSGEGVGS
jgi:hypothetical protein